MRQWTSQSFLFRGLSFLSQDPPKITPKKIWTTDELLFFFWALAMIFLICRYHIFGLVNYFRPWRRNRSVSWRWPAQLSHGGFFCKGDIPRWLNNKQTLRNTAFFGDLEKTHPQKNRYTCRYTRKQMKLTWKPQDNCWFRLIDDFFDLLGGITYIHVHPLKIHRLSMDQKSGSSATGMYS